MIPSTAIKSFLRAPRDDLRCYKRMSDAELQRAADALPVRPPIWSKLLRDQRVMFIAAVESKRLGLWCDTGCVAAETLVETENGPIRIDELESRGQPIKVWSNTKFGLQLVEASCPFRCGPTELYEVSFSSGEKIVVTAKHRFWTSRGWVACADVLVGERLPKFDVYHLGSNLVRDLLEWPLNALRWFCRQTDYPGCCYQYHRRDGVQPQLEAGSVQVSFPSIPWKVKPICFVYGRGDDSGFLRPSNHQCLSYTTCRTCDRTLTSCTEFLGALFDPRLAAWICRRFVLDPIGGYLRGLVHAISAVHAGTFGAFGTHLLTTSLEPPSKTVTSIKYKCTDVYYDMHVPTHENYIAHGLCHHNTGKTLAALAIARYFCKAAVAKRFLVLVPGNINLAEWKSERDLHSPKTSMVLLSGSSKNKWEQVREAEPTLTVATYGGLVRMVCKKVKVKKGTRVGDYVLKIDEKMVGELTSTFDGLIMDESSADQAVQYKSSLAWRVCHRLSKFAKVKFALSGTPFGRDPTPLWAQMCLIDGGEALGETLGLFRRVFFSESDNYWGGKDYTFKQSMSGKLHRLLAHSSITIEADDASLPPVVSRVMTITLPHEAAEYSNMARDAILAARGNYQETKNAFLRMRQISSGFLGYTDDDTGKRAKFAFDENPKLESLISKIRSVAGKYKMVVFHEFIHSGDVICDELDKMKIGDSRVGYARIAAGTMDSVQRERRRFTDDEACRVLVISNRMSQGPNLQIAKYVEFYESPVDPKTRKQARRRVERQHSQHSRVFITDYVANGTFDQRILDFHDQGQSLFEAIIRGEVKL